MSITVTPTPTRAERNALLAGLLLLQRSYGEQMWADPSLRAILHDGAEPLSRDDIHELYERLSAGLVELAAEPAPRQAALIDNREHAAVLAGLRLYQAIAPRLDPDKNALNDIKVFNENLRYLSANPTFDDIADIATSGGELQPLDAGEVDTLCESLSIRSLASSSPAASSVRDFPIVKPDGIDLPLDLRGVLDAATGEPGDWMIYDRDRRPVARVANGIIAHWLVAVVNEWAGAYRQPANAAPAEPERKVVKTEPAPESEPTTITLMVPRGSSHAIQIAAGGQRVIVRAVGAEEIKSRGE
jgi:hypothetical protein